MKDNYRKAPSEKFSLLAEFQRVNLLDLCNFQLLELLR